MALCILRVVINKEKNDISQGLEFVNVSLLGIETLCTKGINHLSKRLNLDLIFGYYLQSSRREIGGFIELMQW